MRFINLPPIPDPARSTGRISPLYPPAYKVEFNPKGELSFVYGAINDPALNRTIVVYDNILVSDTPLHTIHNVQAVDIAIQRLVRTGTPLAANDAITFVTPKGNVQIVPFLGHERWLADLGDNCAFNYFHTYVTPFGYWLTTRCRALGTWFTYFAEHDWQITSRLDTSPVVAKTVISDNYYRPKLFIGNTPDTYVLNHRGTYYIRRVGEKSAVEMQVQAKGRILNGFVGHNYIALLCSTGKRITGNFVKLVCINTGKVVKTYELPHAMKRVLISPDNLLLCGWGCNIITVMDLD